MLKRFGVNYTLFSLIADFLGIAVALWASEWLRITLKIGTPLIDVADVQSVFLHWAAPIGWLLVALALSLYDPSRSYKVVDELQTVTLTALLYAVALAGFLYLTDRWLSRLLLVYYAGTLWMLVFSWRVVARGCLQLLQGRVYARRRVLIVGAGDLGQQIGRLVQDYHWTGLELVGYLDDDHQKKETGLPVVGTVDEARSAVEREGIEEVVVALPQKAYGRLNQLVAALHELPVRVRVVPDYFSLALYRATVDDFAGLPMINLRDPALNDMQRLVKRLLDLILGAILTLLALPLMGLVALAIKIDDGGPALFPQQRIGENRRAFTMYKFRSMIVEAEQLQHQINELDAQGHIIHKKLCDPRVTRVGHVIRRFSLDELPQLFNVLKGELSLVGPRPELPWLVKRYESWQMKRFAVPQGITGWWQVNGRSDKPMHLHTEDDLFYIQNYSLWMDISILWKTIWVTVRGRGAY